MAIGGNQFYQPIFNAVDMLVQDANTQKDFMRRQQEVKDQRAYQDKTKREAFIGDLLYNEFSKPNQTPESQGKTQENLMNFIQDPERTSSFFDRHFNRADQVPTNKPQVSPSKLAVKYFGDYFKSGEMYDADLIKTYEQEATKRENNILDFMKQSGAGKNDAEDKDPKIKNLKDAIQNTLRLLDKGSNQNTTDLQMNDKGQVTGFTQGSKKVGDNRPEVIKYYNRLQTVLNKYRQGKELSKDEQEMLDNPQAYLPVDQGGMDLQKQLMDELGNFRATQDSLQNAWSN